MKSVQLVVSLALVSLALRPSAGTAESLRHPYPKTERGSQVDRYHGVEVEDPYRWLEELEAPAVRTWAERQDRLTQTFVHGSAGRQRLGERIAKLGDTGELYGTPRLGGGRYVYMVGAPGWGPSVFRMRTGLRGEETLLHDPNPGLEDDQTVSGDTLSPGGGYLGYRVSRSQSRWGELRLVRVPSGERGDLLTGVTTASVAWMPDDSGFFYVHYGDSEELRTGTAEPTPSVRFHKMGEPQSRDRTIVEPPEDFSLTYRVRVVGDRPHLVVSIFEGTLAANRLLVADLGANAGAIELRELTTDGSGIYTVLGGADDELYVFSNAGAPNGRILAVDLGQSQPPRWREVVAEGESTIAGSSTAGGNAINMVGRHLTLVYRRANQAWLRVYALDGRLEHEIELEAGWIGSGLQAGKEEVWYTFSGLLEPHTVYRLDFATGRALPFFQPETPIKSSEYVTRQVHYESKDGTWVPLFVAHRKGLELDGSAPLFMYGYGFGGWVAVPWYQPHMIAWMDMGGVYALPGVRGGGEYGDSWEQAGIRLNRQNAIDDYIAAAEWLVSEGYTSKGKVAANGWSASGALAAASVLQRPDLFGAGVIGIPSLDLLRHHLFTPFKGWSGGFGSSDDPEEFAVLRSYSPYHNISPDDCPPPFIVTVGEKDDRTPPMHGYKFVARLQERECGGPALLHMMWDTGHIFGTTPEQSSSVWADKLTFLTRVLGLERQRTPEAP